MFDFTQYCDHMKQCFEMLKKSRAECEKSVGLMVEALRAGNKIIFCGNGGSAADSQHLAAELMGRFLFDRAPMAALSLTVDTSALTAIGNDYGYDKVFSRQLSGIGRKGDVLVGMSTSGNSQNVVEAFLAARKMGIHTIAMTGASGGKMAKISDVCLSMPSDATNHIQEMHIVIGHWLCGMVEERMCLPSNDTMADPAALEKKIA